MINMLLFRLTFSERSRLRTWQKANSEDKYNPATEDVFIHLSPQLSSSPPSLSRACYLHFPSLYLFQCFHKDFLGAVSSDILNVLIMLSSFSHFPNSLPPPLLPLFHNVLMSNSFPPLLPASLFLSFA